MDATRSPMPRPHLLARSVLVTIVAMLTFASGVVAATPSPQADVPALAFTSWRLASLQTAGNPVAEPDAGETLSLAFGADDAVTVTAACVTATGTLATGPDGAVVPNVVVTGENTCERRSVPERFVNLLNLATSWDVTDAGALVLGLTDGGTIRLEQMIQGTTWRWTGFQGGDDATVTPETADAALTLTFGEDGMVHVAAGCATGDLPYTLEGTSGLAIDASGLEMSGCADGSAAARLAQDLGFMRSYVFRDGRLFVSLLADGGIHAFEASDPAS